MGTATAGDHENYIRKLKFRYLFSLPFPQNGNNNRKQVSNAKGLDLYPSLDAMLSLSTSWKDPLRIVVSASEEAG